MATQLFVGGISYNTTEQTLRETFEQAGSVTSATIVMDKMTGQSRGFAFVEMASEEEANKAIEMFNGASVDGRKIAVNIARPKEERAPRDFNR